MIRPCPHCWCEDSCGREEFVSRPCPYLGPTPTEVYAAVFEFYGHDRSVLDVDSSCLARDLVSSGYLDSMPRLVDVGQAQELIRESNASIRMPPLTAEAEGRHLHYALYYYEWFHPRDYQGVRKGLKSVPRRAQAEV